MEDLGGEGSRPRRDGTMSLFMFIVFIMKLVFVHVYCVYYETRKNVKLSQKRKT
jgi:hypothetical protein